MLKIRLTKSEMGALKERADAEGLSLSAWGRSRLLSVPDEALCIYRGIHRRVPRSFNGFGGEPPRAVFIRTRGCAVSLAKRHWPSRVGNGPPGFLAIPCAHVGFLFLKQTTSKGTRQPRL
ncbi:hypothetical protein [Rhodomicrobium udaipurense]